MDEIMGVVTAHRRGVGGRNRVVGGVVYLTRHRLPVTNYRVFAGEPVELRTISGILHEALALHGRGVNSAGVAGIDCDAGGASGIFAFCIFVRAGWTYVLCDRAGLGTFGL